MKEGAVKWVKRVMGTVEWLIKPPRYQKDDLLVLCYHATPTHWLESFEQQIVWLKQKGFKFMRPSEIDPFYEGKQTNGPYVLFTFDDGLANNLHAAAVLERHGAKAVFFLVPGFMETPQEGQATYYQRNIRPEIDPDFEPIEERCAMTVDEVKFLLKNEHAIGAHTFTHTLVADELDIKKVEHEVLGSKNRLQEMFGLEIKSFCSINQTDLSVGPIAAELIRTNYVRHYTTFPGVNQSSDSQRCIYRRNTEVNWSQGEFKFAVGRWMLRRWASRIANARANLRL